MHNWKLEQVQIQRRKFRIWVKDLTSSKKEEWKNKVKLKKQKLTALMMRMTLAKTCEQKSKLRDFKAG